MNEKTRIQFDLNESKLKEIEALIIAGGLDSRKELFNNALTLLSWAVREAKKGRTITSLDESGQTYTRLLFPMLETAARKGAHESAVHLAPVAAAGGQ